MSPPSSQSRIWVIARFCCMSSSVGPVIKQSSTHDIHSALSKSRYMHVRSKKSNYKVKISFGCFRERQSRVLNENAQDPMRNEEAAKLRKRSCATEKLRNRSCETETLRNRSSVPFFVVKYACVESYRLYDVECSEIPSPQ